MMNHIYVTMKCLLYFTARWLVAYLYLKRQPLSWSQSMYGGWEGFRNVITGTGSLIILPLIKRYSAVPDTIILGLALLSTGASMILIGLSKVTVMVFLGKLVFLSKYLTLYTYMKYFVERTSGMKFL